MNIRPTSTPRSCRQDNCTGFTLVELMIAMTISLGMVTALVTLLVNNSRTSTELDRSSRQIENGRYAMEVMAANAQLAGYYGELTQTSATWTTTDPCATALADLGIDASPLTVPVAVQGFRGVTADPAPACLPNHKAGTQVLVVRHVDTTAIPAASALSGNGYLQTSRCASDPVGTPLVFSDNAADFNLRTLDCGGVQTVRRLIARAYYIAECDVCGRDSIPTLKRAELTGGAIKISPLSAGIEELQFEFGFDSNNNGTPDVFLPALSGVGGAPENDWRNVMAVRIWLISRTTEASQGYTDTKTYDFGALGTLGPFNDRFKRRAYSQLVRLNNPAGMRE